MKLHEAIGLELERQEKCASRQHCEKAELQARIEALEDALHAILGEEVGFDETESLAKIFIVARQALEGER